ncbi:hypothetical protein SAMN04487926_1088 [Paraburkholderia steynii]|uniref:NERD domain-containing protein n=1 Tax=Paraburkholderia steynii TaxID=1245441 RepID=A0A7Z7FID1_9BURK|nr:NERD domain-containing protein [Paraburkholderia steynii]SDH78150.1 hypothetical protein SAMN04487926_1088 [Paraburkholderia steynii]
MGEFLKAVRSGAIAGPRRSKFKADKWKNAFDGFVDSDDEDQALYDAGLVIHAKLENIRARLKLSTTPKLKAVEKTRAFVAAANHGFLVTQSKTRDAFERVGERFAGRGAEGFRPDEVFAEIKLELPGGFDWSPNEIVESLVEGIEVPVRFALSKNPDLSGNPRMAHVTWEDIQLELNLGIMYRHTEDLWDECLWNSYEVMSTKLGKVFFPIEVDVKRAQAIGIARRTSLWAGFTFMMLAQYRQLMARGATARIRDIRDVRKDGKRQLISVAKPGEGDPAMQESLAVLHGLASEPYYEKITEVKLPTLEGVTLSDVLDAWAVVSRIASIQLEALTKAEKEVDQDEDQAAHKWLPAFVPVLQVDALVQALLLSADIPPVKGRRIIEFFTFKGEAGQELWDCPLVPIGPRTVSPVFPAIITPNLRRLVDVWMRRGGIDLEVRGAPFEAHIRHVAQRSIAQSEILANTAAVIPHGYKLKPSAGRDEEIDLVVIIGSTVILGESKCILEPTEAKGFAMHRHTVFHAAEQAQRKAQALRDNRAQFVSDVQRLGIPLDEKFTVVPIIVVSTSTHVGVPANGVPVVDEYILAKFLVGELEDAAVDGASLEVLRAVKQVFYNDVADAESKAAEYFSLPPQVRKLVEGTAGRMIPLHAIDENDWEGLMLTIECVPRTENDRLAPGQ